MNQLTTQDTRLTAIEAAINSVPSPNTKRMYKHYLYNFLEWHNQQGQPLLTKSIISKYISQLLDAKGAKVSNHALSAIKKMVKEAEDNGLIDPTYATGIDRIKGFKVTSELSGRAMLLDEIIDMLNACDDVAIGLRDKAIVCTLYMTGLRRSELVNLNLSDYKQDRIIVRHGKGNKERHCYTTDELREMIDRWLSIRGHEAGPLFTRIRKSNQVTLNRLCSQAIYHITKQLQDKAGIESITPHDFRRTFITNLLINKIPIDVVKDMAGHSDISTTSRYNRQDKEQAMSEAIKVLRIF